MGDPHQEEVAATDWSSVQNILVVLDEDGDKSPEMAVIATYSACVETVHERRVP